MKTETKLTISEKDYLRMLVTISHHALDKEPGGIADLIREDMVIFAQCCFNMGREFERQHKKEGEE